MIDFVKQTFAEFSKNRCTTLAAALAYYTIFSLPPLIFLLVGVLSFSLSAIYGSDAAEEKAEVVVQQQVEQMVGNAEAGETINEILDNRQQESGTWWKSLLSIVGILVGATGVVAALQDSLNRVWEVKPDPEDSGIKDYLMKRVLSLGMIVGLGFILLVSLVLSAVLTSAGERIAAGIGIDASLASAINYVVQFLVSVVVFAAIFKFMPDAIVRWRDVIAGAFITAVLFLVGRLVLQLYLGNSEPGAQLGSAAASLAVLLVWVYYTSMIVLYGAEVTQVYATRYGEGIRPEAHAVRFSEVVRQKGGAVS